MKVKRSKSRYSLLFILPVLFFFVHLGAQEQEKIIELVQVENVEIPVRVLDGQQPVRGLKKEDFLLSVNGKPWAINGFYEVRKKLADTSTPPAETPTAPTPRFFVLIFNLSSFSQDLNDQLDILFQRIIRPGDRLMVITNRYFISEWEVGTGEKAKTKIKDALAKEIHTLKFEITQIENELKAIAATLMSQLSNHAEMEEPSSGAIREFFIKYQIIIEDIKDNYLDIPVDQYIKIAEYLKSQQAEKWVLNFYQLGRLPMLNYSGTIYQFIMGLLNSDIRATANLKISVQSLYLDFISKIKDIDALYIADIAKTFLNSGATVHTQLLHPTNRELSDDFKYETVTTESENILRQLSRITGGSVLSSNRTERFIAKITAREDIIYVLTYAPGQKKKKKPSLTVSCTNKNYRVVYDDQKRAKPFNDKIEQLTAGIKNIEIQSLACNGDLITFNLKNAQVVHYEKKNFCAVQVRLKILDKHSRFIAGSEKIFQKEENQGEGTIQLKLPALPNGKFQLVVEVKDLFSLKSAAASDAITIKKE